MAISFAKIYVTMVKKSSHVAQPPIKFMHLMIQGRDSFLRQQVFFSI
jgi:hypothetical protein